MALAQRHDAQGSAEEEQGQDQVRRSVEKQVAARSNHPLAREAVKVMSEATINGLQKDDEAQGYLEGGVD